MSFRDVRFSVKYFFKDLYYFLRTGDQWYEVKYQAWKIYREITQPLRAVKYVFWRMWKYRSILWNDFDWDHGFLLELLELKFLNMAKYHRDYGITECRGEIAMELFECAELCHRIHEDDYTRVEEDAHEAKWGKIQDEHIPLIDEFGTDKLGNPKMYQWKMWRDKANTEELKEQELAEHRVIWDLAAQRKAADLKRLGELIQKMEYWWD